MSTNNCNSNCTNSFGVCAKNNWCTTPIPAEYGNKLTVLEQIAKLNATVNRILCMIDCNGECNNDCNPCGPSVENPTRVSVEAFGAVGDGKYNDTDAFLSAAKYAADNNLTLTTAGRTYLLDPDKIDLSVNFDGNGCTIIPSGNGSAIFKYPASGEDYTLTQAAFSSTAALINTLWGKTFKVVTPLDLGQRHGYDYHMYHTQTMACDDTGKFINFEIPAQALASGNYTITNVRPVDERPLFFRGVTIQYSNYFPSLLECYRNNLDASHILINGTFNASSWSDSVIQFDSCYNCSLRHCVGGNPAGPSSGYALGLFDTSDFVCEQCSFYNSKSNTWPSLGINNITNGTFRDCDFSRFDWHYQLFGYVQVYGGSFGFVNLAGGYGNFIMDGSIIINSANRYALVQWREDLPLMLTGLYSFRNVRTVNYRNDAIFLNAVPSNPPASNYSIRVLIDNVNFFSNANFMVQVNYKYVAYLNFRNMMLQTQQTIRCETTVYATFVDCWINVYDGDNYSPTYSANQTYNLAYVRMTGCTFFTLLRANYTQRSLTLSACNLFGLTAVDGSCVSVVGCAISQDVAPTLGDSVNVLMAGNVIDYSTITNQSKWNNVGGA